MNIKLMQHPTWFKKHLSLTTQDQKEITVFELLIDHSNEKALSEWAKHFREHYCLDSEIDQLRQGTGKSRKEYLLDLVFPTMDTSIDKRGPAVRSGDFAEILVADLIEFNFCYWIPRTRYQEKDNPNQSAQGSDLIGLKILDKSNQSPNDSLIIFEVKGQLSETKPQNKLQEAVNDSKKDRVRLGMSLNAAKRRLRSANKLEEAIVVERFQNMNEKPYIERYAAAAVFSKTAFCKQTVSETNCEEHPASKDLRLLVIHSDTLMQFVHFLYERAADEA